MVDDALAASGLECLNGGGGTTEEVDIFFLSLLSFVLLTSLNGRARELSATLTSGVLANAHRADRGQNKVAARTEQNLV